MADQDTRVQIQTIEQFLVAYYKQHHFNAMPIEVRARFEDHVKNDDLIDHMKDWKKNLWIDADTKKPEPSFVDQNTPNKRAKAEKAEIEKYYNITIGEADIEKLYKSLNKAFSEMANDKTLEYDDKGVIKDFIDEFYGKNRVFHMIKLDANVKNVLKKALFAPQMERVVKRIINQFKTNEKRYSREGDTPKWANVSYESIAKDIDNPDQKYDNDSVFRSILEDLVGAVIDDQSNSWSVGTKDPSLTQYVDQLDSIRDKFEPAPSSQDLRRFRAELPDLLNIIYSKKKAREAFQRYERSGIIGALNTAREQVDYDNSDSKNYIEPKMEDELTVWQWMKKGVSDKYSDYLKKYEHLRGDHTFRTRQAKDIFAAMDKAKIKPTDGLNAIIEKASEIKNNGKLKTAGEHFDWFVKELGAVKKGMPKAFDSCLNHGWQLRDVVMQVITDALDQNKEAELETALEVLVVMQYSNTHSGIMDKIKENKELFTIFSNPDISINKGIMGGINKALDATIRIGALTVGAGLTFAFNNIQRIGRKINKDSGNKYFQATKEKRDNTENNTDLKRLEGKRDAASRLKREFGKEQKDLRKEIIGADAGLQAKWGSKLKARLNKGEIAALEQDIETSFDSNIGTQDAEIKQLGDDIKADLKKLIPYLEEDTIDSTEYGEELMLFYNSVAQYIKGEIEDVPTPPAELLGHSNTTIRDAVNQVYGNLTTYKQAKEQKQDLQDKRQKYLDASEGLRAATEQEARYKKKIKDWQDEGDEKHQKVQKYIKLWNELIAAHGTFGKQHIFFGSTKNRQDALFEEIAKAKAA